MVKKQPTVNVNSGTVNMTYRLMLVLSVWFRSFNLITDNMVILQEATSIVLKMIVGKGSYLMDGVCSLPAFYSWHGSTMNVNSWTSTPW